MSFGNKGQGVPNRFPRVLFFTVGMVPTDDETETAAKYYPNVALRNASAVAALPMSPLEECDAVAGAIPPRYAAVYPDVNNFDGSSVLRMSDYDRPHGAVTDLNNEAARAAKPAAFGETAGRNQGAERAAGAITAKDGGFVAPSPAGSGNLPMFGAERVENAAVGAQPVNPHGLPDAGVTALTGTIKDADRVGLTTPAAPGTFAPPAPVASEETDEEMTPAQKAAATRAKNKAEEEAANK